MRLLLVSTNEEDKKFFQEVARAAQWHLLEVKDAELACDELLKDSDSILVVDSSTAELFKAFEDKVAEKIGLYSAILNPNMLFFVASQPFQECSYLHSSEIFGNFIHRCYSQVDLGLAVRLFTQASSERAFGLENFFPTQARTQTIKITKTLQKKVIVESLKNHLLKIGFKPRMAMLIATAADELIMNAIFDAPVDELGRRIHTQTPRNAVFDLAGTNEVEMKIAFDGKTLGLSVADLHGSLDRKKLISQHLGKSYVSSEYEARSVVAGAGLGLSQVYRNCGGIVFACETGARTEVSIFYKKTVSFKEFKDQFRFLSTFVYFAS